jgi:hypothetical protein
MGVSVLRYGLEGVLVLTETQKKSKTLQKTHPECMKIGKIASEVRRRLMDDEQP